MKTKIIDFALKIFILIILLSPEYFSQRKIVHAKIDGEIDLGLSPFIQRVISDAEEKNADAIIFEINTFGGRVDAATQIKDAILDSKILTIAFVNKRAISAGALITLSCKKIAMANGSSIGATTVVNETGEKQSEKYQSYMRSEMRSTAERNNRRTDIAEGMVDERIVVNGLDDSTTLITLTSAEARKYEIADTVVNNLDEALAAFGFENAELIRVNSNWAEDFVRFLNNPIISSLLIMIGLVGLFTEIKTPGWGLPGTAALIALGLFFGASFILDLASGLEIIMFIGGVVLLLLEIFVIPGFGIAGIGGIILILASLFLSLINTDYFYDMGTISSAIVQLAASILLAVVAILLLLKYLPKSKSFNKLVLADEEKTSQGFSSNPDYSAILHSTGVALTPLRPAGSVIIDGKKYDVLTEGEFIEKGKNVKVIKTEGVKIVVQFCEGE